MPSMTYNISEAKWPRFKAAFLEVHHVPRDPDTGDPTMSETEWIKEWGRLMYLAVVRQGDKIVRNKAHPPDTYDPEIIT